MGFGLLAAAAAVVAATPAPAPLSAPSPAVSAPATAPAPPNPAPPSATAPPPCCVVPAGKVIEVELIDPLSTKTSKPGDSFKLRLVEPIVIGDVTVAPTGSVGEGEVVDARAGQMGGAPGKLILAARYLKVEGQRVPLQSLKLGGSGGDNTGAAVMGAALISPLLIIAVKGGDMAYPAGMRATAKVAAEVTILVPAPAPFPPTSAPAGASAARTVATPGAAVPAAATAPATSDKGPTP